MHAHTICWFYIQRLPSLHKAQLLNAFDPQALTISSSAGMVWTGTGCQFKDELNCCEERKECASKGRDVRLVTWHVTSPDLAQEQIEKPAGSLHSSVSDQRQYGLSPKPYTQKGKKHSNAASVKRTAPIHYTTLAMRYECQFDPGLTSELDTAPLPITQAEICRS